MLKANEEMYNVGSRYTAPNKAIDLDRLNDSRNVFSLTPGNGTMYSTQVQTTQVANRSPILAADTRVRSLPGYMNLGDVRQETTLETQVVAPAMSIVLRAIIWFGRSWRQVLATIGLATVWGFVANIGTTIYDTVSSVPIIGGLIPDRNRQQEPSHFGAYFLTGVITASLLGLFLYRKLRK